MDADYKGIFETVGHYVHGARTGRSEEMALAFAPGATICGHDETGLFAGSIQKLLDWNQANGAAADIQASIRSIEVAQTVAQDAFMEQSATCSRRRPTMCTSAVAATANGKVALRS